MKDIQYKHQLQYTALLQESAQALQAAVPDQGTPKSIANTLLLANQVKLQYEI